MVAPYQLPDDLLKVSDRWAWLGIARSWVLILGAVALAGSLNHWAAWVAAFIIIGVAQYHLLVLGHHSLHRNLFSADATNEFASKYFVLAPVGLPLTVSRSNHVRHHVHFQTPDDYEWHHYNVDEFRQTPSGFLIWTVGGYFGLEFLLGIKRVLTGLANPPTSRRKEDWPARNLKDFTVVAGVQLCILAGLTLATGSLWAYPLLWILPMLTLMSGLSATRATLEHMSPDLPPNRLLTFPRGLIQRFLIGPFNFNFHSEHHLYVNVPACNLGKLHHYLAARGELGDVLVCDGYFKRAKQVMAGLAARERIAIEHRAS